MNQDIMREWVDELRNGDRQQGTGALHVVNEDGTESFCCLGVLEDILVRKGLQQRVFVPANPDAHGTDKYDHYAYFDIDGTPDEAEESVLSHSAVKYCDLVERNPDVALEDGEVSLAELNDDGYTFAQIADLIESNFGGNNEL